MYMYIYIDIYTYIYIYIYVYIYIYIYEEKLVAELSKFQALPASKPKPLYILALSPELFLFSP
jgi:hypothetical protein